MRIYSRRLSIHGTRRPLEKELGIVVIETIHWQHCGSLTWGRKGSISEGKQLSVFPELLFSDACVYVLPFTGVKNSHCLNQVVKKPAEEDCSLFQVSRSQQAEDDRVSSHY